MPSTVAEAVIELPDYSDYLHVAVAIVDNGRGEVLLARRHEKLHQGGLWEFPGGKVESSEEVFSALSRELEEELAIKPVTAHPLIRIPYHYPDRKVLLDVWRVTGFRGEPQGAEGQPVAWVAKAKLGDYEFPAANRSLIVAAQLPSCYLITPEPGAKDEWPDFCYQLQHSLASGVRLVQLRATTLCHADYLELAHEVLACCQQYGARLLLNADAQLLDQCDADGIHLNSHRLMAARQRPVAEEKLLAASCHTLEELQQAERLGVDFAMLSPVKPTASHPGIKGMGWQQFRGLSEQISFPLYALGGMTQDDLSDAWQQGAQGIAAIRALWGGAEEIDKGEH